MRWFYMQQQASTDWLNTSVVCALCIFDEKATQKIYYMHDMDTKLDLKWGWIR